MGIDNVKPVKIGPYMLNTRYLKNVSCMGLVSCYALDSQHPAVQWYDEVTNEPQLRATVYIQLLLSGNECIIKDYSENFGIADCMIRLGLIEPSYREVQADWVTVGVHKMKGELLQAWQKFNRVNYKELLNAHPVR